MLDNYQDSLASILGAIPVVMSSAAYLWKITAHIKVILLHQINLCISSTYHHYLLIVNEYLLLASFLKQTIILLW